MNVLRGLAVLVIFVIVGCEEAAQAPAPPAAPPATAPTTASATGAAVDAAPSDGSGATASGGVIDTPAAPRSAP